jgi:hypothetical protein
MGARYGSRLIAEMLAGIGVVLALGIEPARAQTGATTGLTGHVSDRTGAALPGTTVTLVSAETSAERVVITNATGDWEVRFLSPGTYLITFELTGF